MKRILGLLALLSLTGPTWAQTPTTPAIAAMVCANNTVVPTPVNSRFFYVQCDSNGKLITTASGGGAPSGPAGGSLKGTYPNPGLADVNSVATSFAIGGATIGTDALAWTGTATGSGRLSIGGVTNTGNGAASVSNSLWNGTVFTGGSGTTTFPAMFVQPTGTTAATTWSTSGTGLGMNLASGFAGNFFDFHVAGGASLAKLSSNGTLTLSADVQAANVFIGTNNSLFLRNGSTPITSPATATTQFGAADAAAPVAQTTRVQSVVAGTSNVAGADWTLDASVGTGTGVGGNFIYNVAPATTTGTTQNPFVQAAIIDSQTHLRVGNGTAPAITSCGTGSPTIIGTDIAGLVTAGTAATGCIITFKYPYTSAPFCTVTWQGTPLLVQSYVVTNTAITLTQTSTSGDKINYMCMAQNGG